MAQFGMHEAKTKLSQLVERVEAGEEVIIARNGTPVAKLVAVPTTNALASVYGALHGQVQIADDFDDLPDDIADALGAH